MHPFYRRMDSVFRYAGSNRNRFCRKWGFKYQTLQSYWNSDKLPPGDVLEALAREYHVSLDALVLGRAWRAAPAESGAPGAPGDESDEWAELEDLEEVDPDER